MRPFNTTERAELNKPRIEWCKEGQCVLLICTKLVGEGICRRAGIHVFMVTGDFAVTAAAIASQIGIFTNTDYDTLDTLQRTCIPVEVLSEMDKEGNSSS